MASKSVKVKESRTVSQIIAEIHQRLSGLEDRIAWSIRADQRFKIGQRVKFTKKAYDSHIAPGKHGACVGVVTGTSGPLVNVHVKGYARPSSYHHTFWEVATPATRRKGRRGKA